MSVEAHKRHAGTGAHLRCAVLTVSDSRTLENDRSGQTICSLVRNAGFTVSTYQIIPDTPEVIHAQVKHAAENTDAVLLTGGTGISRRDNTADTVSEMLEKMLPGYGELFRMLSYEDIGPAAMLSRAVGGILNNAVVFAMPGATKAVELAMNQLILPELPHLIAQLRKHPA